MHPLPDVQHRLVGGQQRLAPTPQRPRHRDRPPTGRPVPADSRTAAAPNSSSITSCAISSSTGLGRPERRCMNARARQLGNTVHQIDLRQPFGDPAIVGQRLEVGMHGQPVAPRLPGQHEDGHRGRRRLERRQRTYSRSPARLGRSTRQSARRWCSGYTRRPCRRRSAR